MKKSNNTFSKETPTLDNSTKLKTSAVDRLVEASKGDDSGVDREEVERQSKNKRIKLPIWLKALIIKWWFVGMCCFFFYWGLGNYMPDEWTHVFVLGIGTGAITDLLTNNFFRLLETSDKEYDRYMLFTQKGKIWTLFVNILYAFVLTILIVILYDNVNALIIRLNPDVYDKTSVPFGVEPITYGLIYLGVDMIVISIKNLVLKMVRNNKKVEEK